MDRYGAGVHKGQGMPGKRAMRLSQSRWGGAWAGENCAPREFAAQNGDSSVFSLEARRAT